MSRREVQGRGILKRKRPQQGAGADPGPARRPQPRFPGVCLRIQGHTLGPSEQAAPWSPRLSLRPQGTGGFRLMARGSGGKDGASPWAQASRDGGAAGAEGMGGSRRWVLLGAPSEPRGRRRELTGVGGPAQPAFEHFLKASLKGSWDGGPVPTRVGSGKLCGPLRTAFSRGGYCDGAGRQPGSLGELEGGWGPGPTRGPSCSGGIQMPEQQALDPRA